MSLSDSTLNAEINAQNCVVYDEQNGERISMKFGTGGCT